ncbi:MAG: EVE domain-containing protein [Chitinophagales bacterium]|nr:EVE domain-containing protein [Chitinophagales bacterium]HAE34868.1 EVE domain-containing protein [Bacteroidota bacterium]MCB9019406.1 EVE domain-containing protein [Chitinophagales bacterium]MCB9022271.1 EVE domain-containing protein [Chitinophagales bacterium]HPE98551.1 EVE domain-containing protein [Chitinophagales bacterium]
MQYWLIKSDPETYGWKEMVRDGKTSWDGIRNYAARLHLRSMKKGDRCLFYQSVKQPEVVGVVEVVKTAYPDPTAKDGDWSAVDVKVVAALPRPVTLADIKAENSLKDMVLVNNTRLSTQPVTEFQFNYILDMSRR